MPLMAPSTSLVRHAPATVPSRKLTFLRIPCDPFRFFVCRDSCVTAGSSPVKVKHTPSFWSDQGQFVPEHYGSYRSLAGLFHRPYGIVEDFPSDSDQICLFIAQSR